MHFKAPSVIIIDCSPTYRVQADYDEDGLNRGVYDLSKKPMAIPFESLPYELLLLDIVIK